MVLFIFIYVAVWKSYRQQGTGFKLENYITPGAYLCVSEEIESYCTSEEPGNVIEYRKVYFSEVRKSN